METCALYDCDVNHVFCGSCAQNVLYILAVCKSNILRKEKCTVVQFCPLSYCNVCVLHFALV